MKNPAREARPFRVRTGLVISVAALLASFASLFVAILSERVAQKANDVALGTRRELPIISLDAVGIRTITLVKAGDIRRGPLVILVYNAGRVPIASLYLILQLADSGGSSQRKELPYLPRATEYVQNRFQIALTAQLEPSGSTNVDIRGPLLTWLRQETREMDEALSQKTYSDRIYIEVDPQRSGDTLPTVPQLGFDYSTVKLVPQQLRSRLLDPLVRQPFETHPYAPQRQSSH